MKPSVHFNFQRQLSRRTLLRGTGVALAVPWLNAMSQAFGSSVQAPPKRFIAVTAALGLHAENLNPEETGADYKPSRYLKNLQDLRQRLTVISGTSHPGVSGGHRAEASILTAAPMSAAAQTRNTISLDQLMARELGNQTRFPSLVLANEGTTSPSYTENGSMIPATTSASRLFSRLFVNESREEQAQMAQRSREGQSIMDLVADDVRSLERQLGPGDRDRLDAYFTSVRDLEKRLVENEAWIHRPRPKVDYKKPVDLTSPADFVKKQKLLSDLIHLALSTDSTRFVTLHLGGSGSKIDLPGVDQGYHNLSHHGLDEEKLDQLAIVETAIVDAWADLVRKLQSTSDQNGSLLDQTCVLMTSNLGNASNHNNKNMPVLLAGGSFRHGRHLAFDRGNNYPLPKLYVSLLQQTGLEFDQFSNTSGTMSGLEMS